MIELTSINGEVFLLNCNLIYKVTQQLDTIVTLSNGITLRVEEDRDEIVRRIVAYKRKIYIGDSEEI